MTAVITSTPSDSHTWNLVFLQLLLEEKGYTVANLGACVPIPDVVAECLRSRPDLVAVSSVNGHGYAEGKHLIDALRAEPSLRESTAVIGGMLSTTSDRDASLASDLVASGYDAAFTGDTAVDDFRLYLATLRTTVIAHAS